MYSLRLPRVSAYSIEFASQIHKKSGRVPDFLFSKREKVSEQELSDDFGTAYSPFLLSAKPWFRDSYVKIRL